MPGKAHAPANRPEEELGRSRSGLPCAFAATAATCADAGSSAPSTKA
jgi:hypothetical protein